jgi:ribosomal protein S21
VQVLVRDNNVDQALKALKKKMQREGIFREMKGGSDPPGPQARAQEDAARRFASDEAPSHPGRRSGRRQRRWTRTQRRTTALRLIVRAEFGSIVARADARAIVFTACPFEAETLSTDYFQQNLTSASFCLRVA